MGKSCVRTLFKIGAHIVFGDIDEASSQNLITELQNAHPTSTGSLAFSKLDVRSYEQNLYLFQLAFDKHGRIDHALSIAGVTEGQNWFDPTLDLESIKTPPSTAVLDINLLGALYFARIAAVYLRQGHNGRRDKSLLLTGSLASFKEQPGLFVYQPAKHGVLGLLRSTRKALNSVHGIRINIVCPSLISTAMASRIQHIWEENGLPINTAAEVADFALTLTAAPTQANGAPQTGLVVSVEGGKGWEIEMELDRLDRQWMGDELAHNTAETNKALGVGSGWTTDQPKL